MKKSKYEKKEARERNADVPAGAAAHLRRKKVEFRVTAFPLPFPGSGFCAGAPGLRFLGLPFLSRVDTVSEGRAGGHFDKGANRGGQGTGRQLPAV